LDQITSAQLSEWEAYDKLDPVGTWRSDFQMAQLISLIHNVVNSLYCKKGSQPIITSALDFMPDWDGEEKKPIIKKTSSEEIKQIFAGIAKDFEKNEKREKLLKERNLKPKLLKH
jgi:hypothetical protein